MLEITETIIRINPDNTSDVLAFADIVIDGCFKVSSLAIKSVRDPEGGQDRVVLKFPAKTDRKGAYRDIAHPISRDAYEYIFDEVLKQYDEAVSQVSQEASNG